MRQRKHLNRKGKWLVFAIMTITAFIIAVLVGDHEATKAKQSSEPISSLSAAPIIPTFESKEEFSNSALNQSIKEKSLEEKEALIAEKRKDQREKEQQTKAIYLTFDDGPTSHTDQLLDILDQYEMQATFFMLGPNIKQYPDAVKRMANEKFGLGLHGISHNIHDIYQNSQSPTKEMKEAQQILENVTGIHSPLIRLPYGSVPYLTEEMRYSLYQHEFTIWDWNVDSEDWELGDARYVQTTIKEIEELEQSGQTPVVLLHDKKETITHLPKLLSYLKNNGYHTEKITKEIPALTFTCNGRCYAI
ncbi:polysaccharide deacetylase family protein [Virgibacillus oceani]|uniref:Polysaccharide deacetylase YheN n=1 Tax=Virgibacillus oceani TaxID=1479511 RepID=A0A917M7V3_9BACI|nr:polysaccharide deacetylase family protein [Virgibacillus oceani]GGG84765.1 putative polysaccharide deacetylase YheN [Virgibacillus oceani]